MQIYITDKSGKKFWSTEVTANFASGERANFQTRLNAIKSGAIRFIDKDSAKIVEELSSYDMTVSPEILAMTDDELLAELEAQA